MKKTSFILTFSLLFLINFLFSYVDFRIDLTEDKKHSISEETKQIISNLNDIVFIKVYLDGEFPVEFNYLQNELLNLLNNFKQIAPKRFDFEVINPNETDDEQEKKDLFRQLVKNGLTPTDIEIRSSNSQSNQIIFPGAIIYYKNRQKAVNFLQNSIAKRPAENINISVENLEYEFASAIHQLSRETNEKIAFLEGNGELTINQVYDLTQSVLNLLLF